MKRQLLLVFLILSVLNVFFVFFHIDLGVILTKPFLMIILGIWFYYNIKNSISPLALYIIAGILFSFIGDTFLMLKNNSNAFLFGLGCFFITHIFYITTFLSYKSSEKGLLFKNKWIILVAAAYLFAVVYFLIDDIPSNLFIPVIAYSTVITTMLLCAINVSAKISKYNNHFIIWGSLLFVFSDSLIAISKFKNTNIPVHYWGTLIMITYLIGQFLIVKSTIYMNNSDSTNIISPPKRNHHPNR